MRYVRLGEYPNLCNTIMDGEVILCLCYDRAYRRNSCDTTIRIKPHTIRHDMQTTAQGFNRNTSAFRQYLDYGARPRPLPRFGRSLIASIG
jgi:hypothetical protein